MSVPTVLSTSNSMDTLFIIQDIHWSPAEHGMGDWIFTIEYTWYNGDGDGTSKIRFIDIPF